MYGDVGYKKICSTRCILYATRLKLKVLANPNNMSSANKVKL